MSNASLTAAAELPLVLQLPFLRAHRYMRTSQSLLDYSLTQLYREAKRHRFPPGQH